jgi:FAD/FMN-containing dehydrogenase
MGSERRSSRALVAGLAGRLRGDVLGPADKGYEGARTVWNATVDARPALVARPLDAADVASTVGFAREHDLRLSVKGGGHNVAGHAVADGSLMLDCMAMDAVHVDPNSRTVRVGGGATVGEMDRATSEYGLAAVGGIVSTTGVGGLTLGGGWGWLSRSYGLAVDNLRSAEVVTADGEIRRASGREHPDLFWALRGGGGNVGVVTEFEFDLHPVSEVLCGVLVYSAEDAVSLLRFHREFTASAPDALCCYASLRTAPDAPFIPPALRGEPVATAYLCYAGDVAAGVRAVEPLRVRGPLVDLVEPRPYVEFQRLFDEVYEPEYRNYWKSGLVGPDGLTDGAVDTLVEGTTEVTSPYTSVVIEHLGGAINRVDADVTAYPHRDAGYSVNVFTRWADAAEDDRHVGWTRSFFERLSPLLDDGVYVNFLGREGRKRVRAAYGGNYDRLREVKARYDPENVFRGTQNVEPA